MWYLQTVNPGLKSTDLLCGDGSRLVAGCLCNFRQETQVLCALLLSAREADVHASSVGLPSASLVGYQGASADVLGCNRLSVNHSTYYWCGGQWCGSLPRAHEVFTGLARKSQAGSQAAQYSPKLSKFNMLLLKEDFTDSTEPHAPDKLALLHLLPSLSLSACFLPVLSRVVYACVCIYVYMPMHVEVDVSSWIVLQLVY